MTLSLLAGVAGWAWLAVLTAGVAAQTPARPPAKLGDVLSAFVPAAGTQTKGLPWTIGGELPVTWESAAPVVPPPYEAKQGFTMKRTGALVVDVGAARKDATIQVLGNQAGVQQVTVAWQELSGPFDRASLALAADGAGLKPLKCRRDTEPPSFGNVVQVAQFKGKIGVALWESWNCGHDGCGFSMTLLYRPTAVDQIECIGKDGGTRAR